MIEITKTTIGIAAGVAGTIFLGYCIYFDKKRRSDPEYKKKVRERRRRQLKQSGEAKATKSVVPNLNDHEAMERYFLQEIQLGETLIGQGEFDSGVEHLANAVVVCGQPARLLQILQGSLSSQVFAMLILKMQEFGNRAASESEDDKPLKSINADMTAVEPTTGGFGGGSVGDVVIEELK